jgi:hypothetical protein
MKYLIQDNTFREKHYNTLINTLDRLSAIGGIEYETLKVKPFINELTYIADDGGYGDEYVPTRTDVIVFGGTSMSKACPKYGLVPGTFLNENHDARIYSPKYGKHMLNADAVFMDIFDPLPTQESFFFARPTDDDKQFKGQVFTKESWNKYIQDILDQKLENEVCRSVMIASEKDIYQEVRCWIVKGKVITTSQYSANGNMRNTDHELDIWEFAQRMSDLYQPSDAFVLDICRTQSGFRIVEINCINSAGFYEMDCQRVIFALETAFSK